MAQVADAALESEGDALAQTLRAPREVVLYDSIQPSLPAAEMVESPSAASVAGFGPAAVPKKRGLWLKIEVNETS